MFLCAGDQEGLVSTLFYLDPGAFNTPRPRTMNGIEQNQTEHIP